MNNISNKIDQEQSRMSPLNNPIQYHTGNPSQGSKIRKGNKRHTDWEARNAIVYLQMT